MRTTTKTMIKLLGWAHSKRRSFLAVKRAARDVICARFFEWHVPLDDIDDIYAIEQTLNERLWNHLPEERQYYSNRVQIKKCK